MRGQEFSAMAIQPQDAAPIAVDTPATASNSLDLQAQTPADNVDRLNMFSWTYKAGSLTWALLLLMLYVFWGYFDEKESISKTLKVGEMKANLSNFFKVTLIVVIGINLINVFLTKMATLNIPFVSKFAAAYIPLFSI